MKVQMIASLSNQNTTREKKANLISFYGWNQGYLKTYFKFSHIHQSHKTDSVLLSANHAYYVLQREALEKGKPLSEKQTNKRGRVKYILKPCLKLNTA